MSVNGGASGGDAQGAVTVAQEFIDAVVWGDHGKVWELLGVEGRSEVLDVAGKRGMDEELNARLRLGTGNEREMTEFLTDLVNGLRSELAGNDVDHLSYELDPTPLETGRVSVVMHIPLHPNLGGTLPIGNLELSSEGGEWRVEKLLALKSK